MRVTKAAGFEAPPQRAEVVIKCKLHGEVIGTVSTADELTTTGDATTYPLLAAQGLETSVAAVKALNRDRVPTRQRVLPDLTYRYLRGPGAAPIPAAYLIGCSRCSSPLHATHAELVDAFDRATRTGRRVTLRLSATAQR